MNLKKFEEYLKRSRNLSQASTQAYLTDMGEFYKECLNRGIERLENVQSDVIASYLLDLKDRGRSVSTINRKLASIRAYYKFLMSDGTVKSNPTTNIKTGKLEKRTLEYLTLDEIEMLLDVPNNTLKGKRDRAILELLYATGIRVNELIAADIDDVNTKIGFFTCKGTGGKARIVPIGTPARKAVDVYFEDARDMFVKNNKEERALFVNSNGGRMTRQGLWKLLKTYGKKVGIEEKLTPHILRTSFAVHMVQNGADLKSLQELLGHEDATATQIYLYVTKNRIKDVYDKTHPRA